MAQFRINRSKLLADIDRGIQKAGPQMDALVTAETERRKNQLIKDFLSDPITREIEERGWLWGFIGFKEDRDPIGEITDALEKIEVRFRTQQTKSGRRYYRLIYPDRETIRSITKVDWNRSTRSWAVAIERGSLPDVQRYIHRAGLGRSGQGIQAKKDIKVRKDRNSRGSLQPSFGTVPRQKYILTLLEKFINYFKT